MAIPQLFLVTIAVTGVPQQFPDVPFFNQFVGVNIIVPSGSVGITFGNTAAMALSGGAVLGNADNPVRVTLPLTNANQIWVCGNAGETINVVGS